MPSWFPSFFSHPSGLFSQRKSAYVFPTPFPQQWTLPGSSILRGKSRWTPSGRKAKLSDCLSVCFPRLPLCYFPCYTLDPELLLSTAPCWEAAEVRQAVGAKFRGVGIKCADAPMGPSCIPWPWKPIQSGAYILKTDRNYQAAKSQRHKTIEAPRSGVEIIPGTGRTLRCENSKNMGIANTTFTFKSDQVLSKKKKCLFKSPRALQKGCNNSLRKWYT